MLGALLGNYRVVEQLGEGGMGLVYVGRHEKLGHRVVVKVLRQEMASAFDMVQRFWNEAQAATAIHNPGIAQVFDVGMTPNGQAYFVMELLKGETLSSRLRQRRLEPEACCRIGRQVANVLQSAHAAGITHRDLKPDNLFLVPDPEVIGGERVKVLDFGIAKLTGESYQSGVKTGAGLAMGTPSYMSPEQCRDASTADARSDIYSLGCVLFKMACGRPPFLGKAFVEVVGAHLRVPPPDPRSLAPELPPALAELILHMLEKQPEDRPQTMMEVSRAFDEILLALGGPPARGSSPMRAEAPPPAVPRLAPHAPTLPVQAPSTRAPRPASRPPDEDVTTMPAPPARPPEEIAAPLPPPPGASAMAVVSLPLPAPAPTPVPAPAPLIPPDPPSQSTISSAVGVVGARSRWRVARSPVALGGLALAGAAAAIAVVLASAPPGSAGGQISYGDLATAPRSAGAAAVEQAEAPPLAAAAAAEAPAEAPAAAPAPAASIAAPPEAAPAPAAGELAAECARLEQTRRWAELEQCAARLQPLDARRAAALRTRAVEEARSAPRIAAAEAALRGKHLRRAWAELAQVWPESVDHASLRRRYELAEARAIDALASELDRVKDFDCQEYEQRLAKERTAGPPRVAAEAARRISCAPQACIADALADDGQDQFAVGRLVEALASFEAAYACRQEARWAEKAFVIACNLGDLARAKRHWGRLSAPLRARAAVICRRNQITEEMLDAP